ncbi:hypothetical protein HHK36_014923 [Tetracentron sinense]|uniref:Protein DETOXIFICATION n=1 Tax=Tetracentron sinense TaxID=13715 RepID=A0A834Z3P0_TETSI|nr:hypothetical protein HHK36_014923 [Tetracentron sinense]
MNREKFGTDIGMRRCAVMIMGRGAVLGLFFGVKGCLPGNGKECSLGLVLAVLGMKRGIVLGMVRGAILGLDFGMKGCLSRHGKGCSLGLFLAILGMKLEQRRAHERASATVSNPRNMDREEQEVVQTLLVPISEENGLEVPNKGFRRLEIVEEVKKQLWLAGPLISVSFLQYCLQVISVMFVGHIGELALSSASMATSFASVTGFSLLTGMGSALDTLCGQAYGGKQYNMLGTYMQRAMFVLLLVSVPVAFIWANTEYILIGLGQDPDISKGAGLYARYMIPMLFSYGLLQCLVRFLQAQNIVFPMMIISGVTTLLHFPICWILVFKSGLGNRGAAMANSLSYWINVLLLALYVKYSTACKKTWTGFSKEALHDVPNFLRLAIPSAVMVCLEFWSFEMILLMSGLLPNPQLETSVLSIILNTCALSFNISFGLGSSGSTRVSNELGAGQSQAARLAVRVVILMATIGGLFLGLTMIILRGTWGYLFSNEEEVVRYVATMMPLLATSNFLDGIQCALSGVVRGCGWQKTGAFVNLGAYYLVGIPFSVFLTFVLHGGGKGLWMGIICALFVQVLSFLLITLRTNWDQEVKQFCKEGYG